MEDYVKQRYEIYRSKIDFKISIEEFSRPKTFLELHEKLVGTVSREINQQLKKYDHITYFGCMLFFRYLTDDEIENGPLVWADMEGNAHCL